MVRDCGKSAEWLWLVELLEIYWQFVLKKQCLWAIFHLLCHWKMVVTVHEIIIDRNFSSAEEFTVPAIIAEIEPSTASSILQLLSDRLPLQLFGLGHLKRIRGRTNGSSASRRQQRSKAKNVHAEAGAINELPQEEGAAVEDRRLQIVICSQSNFDLVPEDIKGLLGETFKTAPVPRFCPNSHKGKLKEILSVFFFFLQLLVLELWKKERRKEWKWLTKCLCLCGRNGGLGSLLAADL